MLAPELRALTRGVCVRVCVRAQRVCLCVYVCVWCP